VSGLQRQRSRGDGPDSVDRVSTSLRAITTPLAEVVTVPTHRDDERVGKFPGGRKRLDCVAHNIASPVRSELGSQTLTSEPNSSRRRGLGLVIKESNVCRPQRSALNDAGRVQRVRVVMKQRRKSVVAHCQRPPGLPRATAGGSSPRYSAINRFTAPVRRTATFRGR